MLDGISAITWPVVALVAVYLGAQYATLIYNQRMSIALRERENEDRCGKLEKALADAADRLTHLENRVGRK